MNSIRLTLEQLAFNFGYVDCDIKYHFNSQPFHTWATFSGDIHTYLPKRPGPHFYGRRQRSCPQPANTTFATLWRTYLPHTFNNALTKRCTFRSGILLLKCLLNSITTSFPSLLLSFLRDLQHTSVNPFLCCH